MIIFAKDKICRYEKNSIVIFADGVFGWFFAGKLDDDEPSFGSTKRKSQKDFDKILYRLV